MKTYIHFWHLTQVFKKLEMFQTKVAEKIKICILRLITFFQKSCCLWDNVEKYGKARQATYDNIFWHVRFACWITKVTDTPSEYSNYCFSTATMVMQTQFNFKLLHTFPALLYSFFWVIPWHLKSEIYRPVLFYTWIYITWNQIYALYYKFYGHVFYFS